ncbi:1-aminocyclopropane-1-carboxylate deaminase/D-cysteine desulfhydrase [Nocardioides sp. NPDC057577]|uniref:1-aminocyclopropane-1-carboxylate deaminase/D-cysteine desulfhydrase n=1 Tax=Nocardioides sp. NPDC057577 TaxID=3346171 RepID=UPI00366F4981
MEDRLIAELRLPSPVVEIEDDRLAKAGVRVLLKRDDLIHPEIPGNKWRKLKYNIATARELEFETLLTFGGAYSNHIRATAAVSAYFGFRSIGVIRGEEHLPLNPSLRYAVSRGMRLTYLDRAAYRAKSSDAVIEALHREFGDFYLIPEGGSNAEAVRGCAELSKELDEVVDVVFCAVGTGGTLAGVAAGAAPGLTTVGVPVLKGGAFLEDDIVRLQEQMYGARRGSWRLECDYHFGGYAKRTPELDDFIDDFDQRHGLRLDWLYEAKMMYALIDQVARGTFSRGTTIVALISGSGDVPRGTVSIAASSAGDLLAGPVANVQPAQAPAAR